MADQQQVAERADSTPHDDEGIADHARELRREFSPSRLNESLDEVVKERPMLDHLLDLGIVARAVAIGAAGALILWLLVGPASAALALVVLFLGSWYVLAQRSFDRRRKTLPFDGDGERDDAD